MGSFRGLLVVEEVQGETRCTAVPERWCDVGEHLTLQNGNQNKAAAECSKFTRSEKLQQDEQLAVPAAGSSPRLS